MMALRFTYSNRRDDQIVLRVSPRALDRAFAATDPDLYRTVSNGRHRARVAMLQGLKVIPVIVYRNNAAEVHQVLSRFASPR